MSIVVALFLSPPRVMALTFSGEQFLVGQSPGQGGSPTFVLSSGTAIGPAVAASGSSFGALNNSYTYNIDAVPPSYWLVNGSSNPIDITFKDFAGSLQGTPVTVSNLVVELRVGGGQVVGLLPSSDGYEHLALALQQTSFTMVSGSIGWTDSAGNPQSVPLQGTPLDSQGAEVIFQHNLVADTFDLNLEIGALTASLGSLISKDNLNITISDPGEFFCMDCGFDLPQGTTPPLIPEPSTASLLAVGLGVLSAMRRRSRPA